MYKYIVLIVNLVRIRLMLRAGWKIDKLWYAVATLVGSTVGVGLYGIPFAFEKASFGVGFLSFMIVGGLILVSNLLYGEVILRTSRRHQFVGYVNKYLGKWPRRINIFNFWVSVYGGMVAILIVSGDFLHTMVASYFSYSPLFFSTVFVILASIFVALGLRTVARFDFFMMAIFIVVILILAFVGIPHIDMHSYLFSRTVYWLLPFGVLMFALNGVTGVPLAREVLVGNESKLKKALILGTLIPAILYFIFALVVLGVSGGSTSPDAISGLTSFLGTKIIFIGALFGFLTSSTIFLNLGTALRESLREDFHFKNKFIWFFAAGVPYVLFFSGIRNFIDILSLVGGVAIGIDMILLILVYVQARRKGERMPEYTIRVPNALLYIMILFFVFIAVYTLVWR